jgi:hypothetical protein
MSRLASRHGLPAVFIVSCAASFLTDCDRRAQRGIYKRSMNGQYLE